jgi:hypothetical protein
VFILETSAGYWDGGGSWSHMQLLTTPVITMVWAEAYKESNTLMPILVLIFCIRDGPGAPESLN